MHSVCQQSELDIKATDQHISTVVLAIQCLWLHTTYDNKKNDWNAGLASGHQVPAMQVSFL